MPATERDIQAYIDILRPASLPLLGDSESDRMCPICQEPYPDFDYDGNQDYAVSPWIRRIGSNCAHVFGCLCIEESIRRGERYSMRCPICREQWLGFWQAEPEDAFELDADPLSRAIARAVRERQDRLDNIAETHEPGEFYREGDPEPDAHSFTIPRETAAPPYGVSVVGRVYRSIGLLDCINSIHHRQSVDADELAAVRKVENAVERLWLMLNQRNQHP
jgi:hypothetical protein